MFFFFLFLRHNLHFIFHASFLFILENEFETFACHLNFILRLINQEEFLQVFHITAFTILPNFKYIFFQISVTDIFEMEWIIGNNIFMITG